MKSFFSLLLVLLLSTTASAQINVKEQYAAHEPIVLNCECPGPEGSKKHVIWQISRPAKLREIGAEACVWAPPGKYSVTSTVLLTLEKEIDGDVVEVLVPGGFRQYHAKFVVGNDPVDPDEPDEPDNPQPDPDFVDCSKIPTELGKKICGICNDVVPKKSMNKRKAIGQMFADVASGLETGKFLTVNDSNSFLRNTMKDILNTQELEDDWAKFQLRIGDILVDVPNGRAELIKFYKDVALGLKGA